MQPGFDALLLTKGHVYRALRTNGTLFDVPKIDTKRPDRTEKRFADANTTRNQLPEYIFDLCEMLEDDLQAETAVAQFLARFRGAQPLMKWIDEFRGIKKAHPQLTQGGTGLLKRLIVAAAAGGWKAEQVAAVFNVFKHQGARGDVGTYPKMVEFLEKFQQKHKGELDEGSITSMCTVNIDVGGRTRQVRFSRDRLKHFADWHLLNHFREHDGDQVILHSKNKLLSFWKWDYTLAEVVQDGRSAIENSAEVKQHLAQEPPAQDYKAFAVKNPYPLSLGIAWKKDRGGQGGKVIFEGFVVTHLHPDTDDAGLGDKGLKLDSSLAYAILKLNKQKAETS